MARADSAGNASAHRYATRPSVPSRECERRGGLGRSFARARPRADSPACSRPWAHRRRAGKSTNRSPNVANHVVNAVAVGRRRVPARYERNRRSCHFRWGSCPARCWPCACELIAPSELGAVESAARRKLPLGLARQLLARLSCKGLGIIEGDPRDDRLAHRCGCPSRGDAASWRQRRTATTGSSRLGRRASRAA